MCKGNAMMIKGFFRNVDIQENLFPYICFPWTKGAGIVVLLQAIVILRKGNLCKQLISHWLCHKIPNMCSLLQSHILLSILSSYNSPEKKNAKIPIPNPIGVEICSVGTDIPFSQMFLWDLSFNFCPDLKYYLLIYHN